MTVTEIWADTGEKIERSPTPEEIAQSQADQAMAESVAQAAAQAQAERDHAALSGVQKLRDLGLTDDEIRALGVVIPGGT